MTCSRSMHGGWRTSQRWWSGRPCLGDSIATYIASPRKLSDWLFVEHLQLASRTRVTIRNVRQS